jgi:hypothetical protein
LHRAQQRHRHLRVHGACCSTIQCDATSAAHCNAVLCIAAEHKRTPGHGTVRPNKNKRHRAQVPVQMWLGRAHFTSVVCVPPPILRERTERTRARLHRSSRPLGAQLLNSVPRAERTCSAARTVAHTPGLHCCRVYRKAQRSADGRAQ